MSDEDETKSTEEGPAERLLRAADHLFYEKGYAATGINELLQAAGVAKASFYHHFPSKDELILAYLARRGAEWVEGLRRRVEQESEPRERVLAVFDYLREWLEPSGFRGCAFLNSIPEYPDHDSDVRRTVRKAKSGLREYLGELCAAAGAADATDEVFLLCEGAITQSAVEKSSWPVTAARRAVERRLDSSKGK